MTDYSGATRIMSHVRSCGIAGVLLRSLFAAMLPHRRNRYLAILLLLLFLGNVVVAQKRQSTPKPRLVLIIVVDQFRYDYLSRFQGVFGQGGLKRLLRDGASWTNANYPFIPTNTSPGHAGIMTGAPPSLSGIAGNEWIERDAVRRVTSVGDTTAKLLGGGPGEGANSPRRMLASTVGDELRRATNLRARVIGISEKARAAILPAGRQANAAYWLSSTSGNVISSDYYFSQLPDWVMEFNQTRPLDKYFGARWDRLLPEAEYLKHAGPDSPPWEKVDNAPGDTNAFPHWVTGGAKGPGAAFYNALDHSPFVNDVLVSLAERAIEKEQLGHDNITDLLSISFSGNDYVGHRFGPYSQEVMDISLRLDRQIATLLDFVDARVGLKNTLVIFTADHGVSPLLGQSEARGHKPTQIKTSEVMAAIRAAISSHISSRSGRVSSGSNKPPADYILKYKDGAVVKDAIINGNVYFDLEALKRDGVSLDEITKIAGEAALSVPGISRVFTRSLLLKCASACPGCGGKNPVSDSTARETGRSVRSNCAGLRDPIGSRVRSGFDPRLSGDLIVVQKPFSFLGDSASPANHGSPYSYDTHVPMIIMGQGFKPDRYRRPATPLDIAPTVTSVLQIPTPSKSQGRVLREALTRARPTR